MRLSEFLDSRLVLNEPVQDKAQAIDALVILLKQQNRLGNAARFRKTLLENEAEFAAELTPDIAIPHLRSAEVTQSSVAAAYTADGKTVLLIASRNEQEHLQQLSQLAEALLEEPLS